MPSKEIIHLSFGPVSNHITTHYWNAQQSYFTYHDSAAIRKDQDDQDQQETLVDHDVSFKAGISPSGDDTYSPRTLIFDTRQEFGSMTKINPLYDPYSEIQSGDHTEDQPAELAQVERASNRIPVSSYQKRLELEDQGYDPESEDEEDTQGQGHETSITASDPSPKSVDALANLPRKRPAPRYRFWSDFSRVYYHPKSLIHVGGQLMAPMEGSFNVGGQYSEDSQDGRTRFDTIEQGYEIFKALEKEQDTMDENLRWFAEDSDLLQGFQYTANTSDAFSGLTVAYLEALIDEYPKIPHVVFGTAWGDEDGREDGNVSSRERDRRPSRLRRMNNALSLAYLTDLSTTFVPIRAPSPSTRLGRGGGRPQWGRYLGRANMGDMYQSSALIAAHIETATFGMRLRARPESASSLVSRLNWRKDTKIAQLGGCIPTPLLAEIRRDETTTLDPIEALLAAKGYLSKPTSARFAGGSRREERYQSQDEKDAKASEKIRQSWLDLSQRFSLSSSSEEKPIHSSSQGSGHLKPFAMSLKQIALLFAPAPPPPFLPSFFAPQSYNLPTSHPKFFTDLTSQGRPLPVGGGGTKSNHRPKSIPIVSSLYTTPRTGHLIKSCKRVVLEALGSHSPLSQYGIGALSSSGGGISEGFVNGRDGLKELRERFEDLLTGYSDQIDQDESDGGEGRGGPGTDEEWGPEEDDQDELWNL
ncbi:tubulin nucleotide-binding domain-like protein [Violaceomyces palustris]|uniref:Tubulin nucleotide-binding domain-like protein n=1 Tax=Violaceomyces palustris TaxID=1673888 RepID=A0ACD0NZX9_9BASI|nr:tubulin nucleotide-binding domain-like protein [Violaceomyces palustris]